MTVDLEEIRRAREEADCLCTPAEVDAALNQLAADITVRLQDKNPLVYVVMNGG
jgi:hypoxanthine phosphoribosyltransferase